VAFWCAPGLERYDGTSIHSFNTVIDAIKTSIANTDNVTTNYMHTTQLMHGAACLLLTVCGLIAQNLLQYEASTQVLKFYHL